MSHLKNSLNLTGDEIKFVKIPQLDFKNNVPQQKLPTELSSQTRELFYTFAPKGVIFPNLLRNSLREVGIENYNI